jgi:MFS family permease
VLALLAFAMLVVSLDQYIVVVALPEIGRDLGFSDQTLQTVVSAYAIASAGFLLLGGRASDLLGRRRMFVTGLLLYMTGSTVGGLASQPEVLLVGRAMQGLGGALVFPGSLSLVNTTFAEGRERNYALSVWSGAGAAGLVVGVLLGGVLTQAFGWQGVFLVNVPMVAVALVGAFVLLDRDQPRDAHRSFDLPGALSEPAGSACWSSGSSRDRGSAGDRRESWPRRSQAWHSWPASRSSRAAVAIRWWRNACWPTAV